MRGVRAVWRLLRMALHLLHGMAVMALRFPALDAAGRQARIRWWSAKLVRLAGLQLEVRGTPRPGAALLLANHVSWLDIAALHAVAPQARFVSKADVLGWPLLGWLIRGAGTLFIDLVDRRTNRLVWRGWAAGSIEGLIDDQAWLEKRIDETVARIMLRLPEM